MDCFPKFGHQREGYHSKNGLWLDDIIINTAQHILHQQFPSIDGFHSTVAVEANRADVLRGGAIQILHIRTNHWICLAVNEDKSGVMLFDSLYSTIPIAVVDKIISLLHSQKDEVQLRSMKMQQQMGGSDCGVIAIAVATSLCNGEDPTTVRWKQCEMRHHLINCFEANRMTPFPKEKDELEEKGKEKVAITHALHCYCRCRKRNREKMMQCGLCKKYFHEKCLNFKSAPPSNWNCDNCSTRL